MKSARQSLVMGGMLVVAGWSSLAVAMTPASQSVFCQLKKDRGAVARVVARPEQVGTICEEVARLMMYNEYEPSRYSIMTGIEYWTADQGPTPKGPKGELDVTVFQTSNNQAVFVGEVKCPLPEEMGWLLDKAHKQTERIRLAIANHELTKMNWDNGSKGVPISPNSYTMNGMSIEIIGPLGSKTNGFDLELPSSRADLMEMADILLNKKPDSTTCR